MWAVRHARPDKLDAPSGSHPDRAQMDLVVGLLLTSLFQFAQISTHPSSVFRSLFLDGGVRLLRAGLAALCDSFDDARRGSCNCDTSNSAGNHATNDCRTSAACACALEYCEGVAGRDVSNRGLMRSSSRA